jgi:UDP-N-acetylglucosamine--N-acetylmuramyl-(pentapeptide) pyrophosphoryl-undecaprenol N-acetylglucosamine transferase
LDARERVAFKYGVDSKLPLVFIFGGSQGSQAINQVVADSLDGLKNREISIIHGVGSKNTLPSETSLYKPLHYIEDMADLYLASDLIIARSGAVTCAEVSALGKYALFIPLPVGNGEQALNAAELVSAKRAEVLSQNEFTADWILGNIDRLIAKSAATQSEGDLRGIHAADMICEVIQSAIGE